MKTLNIRYIFQQIINYLEVKKKEKKNEKYQSSELKPRKDESLDLSSWIANTSTVYKILLR